MPPTEESQWFAEHVEQHAPGLRAYLSRRFPSLSEHEDVLQDAYVQILRAWRQGRLRHARGFLFTAVRNAAIDLMRRRQVHLTIIEEQKLPLLDEALGTIDSIDRAQQVDVLMQAVATLPPRCREVMRLRYFEGLAYKEIAERLGLSPETVKVHLIKGIRDCTHFFKRRGMFDTAPSVVVAS